MNKKSGFTLAEVLVTLMIIGVIAAMTIPSLMQSTAKQEYVTGVKKAISVLNQSLALNYALDGITAAEDTSLSFLTRRIQGNFNAGGGYASDGMYYNWSNINEIIVDVNGQKGPNMKTNNEYIRDQFKLKLNQTKNTIEPSDEITRYLHGEKDASYNK